MKAQVFKVIGGIDDDGQVIRRHHLGQTVGQFSAAHSAG